MCCIRFGHQKRLLQIISQLYAHLVDEILHTDDAEPPEGSLDQVVGGDGGAVTVDLKDGIIN